MGNYVFIYEHSILHIEFHKLINKTIIISVPVCLTDFLFLFFKIQTSYKQDLGHVK